MKLTNNFTLSELTHTNTGLINEPNAQQLAALKELAVNVLQPLREKCGFNIHVNSGFRNLQVNTKVKGSKTSQHMKGEAADITSENNKLLFDIIRNELEFDQLIWENGNDLQPLWVHVSYSNKNRNKFLRMKNGKYFKIK
ncbi:MAG TPA: peptidase M15 [Flavobacterium sp.]|nr:peptidase M15 [Flavobacterium sp.]